VALLTRAALPESPALLVDIGKRMSTASRVSFLRVTEHGRHVVFVVGMSDGLELVTPR